MSMSMLLMLAAGLVAATVGVAVLVAVSIMAGRRKR